MRCLTVTGLSVTSIMARTQAATVFGSNIRQAPKLPF
ncbi:secreted protein [gut metagenome]|uniref:Secreted protein n=1 Tax=gut metagenome TaxID=749906 RepID=J9FLH6_9ZZZZ